MSEEEQWLTVAETAQRLRVSQPVVREMCAGGELGARRVGRQWRIYSTSLTRPLAIRTLRQGMSKSQPGARRSAA
jgi:excisionase family DNA binding protein